MRFPGEEVYIACYRNTAGGLSTDWRSQERLSRRRNCEADLSQPARGSLGLVGGRRRGQRIGMRCR